MQRSSKTSFLNFKRGSEERKRGVRVLEAIISKWLGRKSEGSSATPLKSKGSSATLESEGSSATSLESKGSSASATSSREELELNLIKITTDLDELMR